MPDYPIHGQVDGTIVIIGFGSIGRGTLPLIERHLVFDSRSLVVIEPNPNARAFLKQHGVRHIEKALTRETYQEVLGSVFERGKGFCVNLSVDTSSLDIMRFCREWGVLYLDTVTEPWAGFYFETRDNARRTNYALRQAVRDEKARNPGGTTAVSCCGANPGMVSWFVKEALMTIAQDTGLRTSVPSTRAGWAKLMQTLGVKGIHIAERDTQQSSRRKQIGTFVNTWSTEGFIAEGFQPAELGWGTHERWFPEDGNHHSSGCKAAIWLARAGAITRVHSWCPTHGPQHGFLVTHNEAISISDYYTVHEGEDLQYRPTCHYAYHPCDDAVLSLHEAFGSGKIQDKHHILHQDEIVDGMDELGVLVYGHAKNAIWYGSSLTIDEARDLAPFQNATGLQVSSAVLAGMVWALENPNAGIVETDEMDHARCLEIQRPYLGTVTAQYTDWTPLTERWSQFEEEIDESDPWSFINILAT
ncbi:MAG: saccharopine dehydrogenase NADP-binding domain-containing protein [Burkholderiaceae bacterium]|nr:saccharopine dehydrogenase NADP-binding domain-containing protein [Burkholderiaceae bacterium]